ncbi:MAG TPA: outer membrane protein assembly factor BamD [Longimicrobium sp.]|nr:outer membrane protein assembly factor BamD [Longimicrobium sp.]
MTDPTPIRRAALALLAAAALQGCAVFRAPPQLTPETAYTRGMEAAQGGRWRRAADLLGQFTQAASPGDPRLRDALMTLGRAHLETRDYITAGADYLRVVTEYPTDPAAIQARFGICDAYHRLSPRPQLDQEYTLTGIAYCDSYAQLYPATPEAENARVWVVEMREKLAVKALLNGSFYMRRALYDAAVVYFNEVLQDYPQSASVPGALLGLVQAYGRMGYREEEQAARERLLREFPQSEQARSLAPAADTSRA